MITKGKLIELIRAELGAASDDSDEKFSYEVVEANVDLAILEVARQSDQQMGSGPMSILGAISMPFRFPKQREGAKDYVQLSPRPIMSTSSITAIIGDDTGNNYGIRVNTAQVVIMAKLKSNGLAGGEVIDNKLYFSKPIEDNHVTVYYVPSFQDMDDDTEISVEGAEIIIKDLVKARLGQRIQYPQDAVNNTSEDVQTIQNK
jgi:hypothetical protein